LNKHEKTMYAKDPATTSMGPLWANRDNPKSHNLQTGGFPTIRMFSGFKSPWMTGGRSPWRYSTPYTLTENIKRKKRQERNEKKGERERNVKRRF
jgi:hypothetical protein